ncbi:MAG: exo-alpha-sialidase, partial [Deltaproteobacteria bacterium]|nr:exo-alpha-sialidase [Deltaproteobacteria bacterium]
RLHAVAIEGGPGGGFGTGDHRIHYTVSADGGRSFARPITVSRSDETLPYFFANPSIAVDTRRRWLYIAYVRGGRDARWDLVIAASRNGGQTWSRTRIGDDPACAIHMVPNLALDPTTGKLHLAWYDSRGPEARFAHAVCGPGATRCTQLGRINDIPFAALSTTRDGARSIGDHQALVVDDKRRTLHAVWTQPVAGPDGTITSRIFHARTKLR